MVERIYLALEKYSKRLVSLGRGAELAKISLVDFIKIVAERKISINYSEESLEDDLKAALKER